MSPTPNDDRWPVLEFSQISVLGWLSKHVPEFKELSKEHQGILVIRSIPRVLTRQAPLLILIFLAIPACAGGFMFTDRMEEEKGTGYFIDADQQPGMIRA